MLGAKKPITDSGAELLIAAIYSQAKSDLEDFYGRVRQHQKNCEKGVHQPANYTYDDFTAVYWNCGPKRSRPVKEMVETCTRYIDRCQKCAGGGLDVQREGA
jgi:hypothetical protein